METPEGQTVPDVQEELQKIVNEREALRIKLTRQYFEEEVIPAKEKGKTVIYTPGSGFGEIVYAFDDCVPVAPSDNYAVYTTARRQHRKYLEIAEGMGLSPDTCSYDRVGTGLMVAKEGRYGPLPPPDLIIGWASVCDTHAKYWEIVSDYFGGVPFFPFDLTYPQHDEHLPDYAMEYAGSQVRSALEFIAEHTGKKLDWDRFRETVRTGIEAITYYFENVSELRTAVPSPWSTIQAMGDTFFIVAFLGRPEAKQYFELVAKEVKFRVKHKIGINPNEKYRLFYTDIPPWFSVGLLREFHERGGTLAVECYPTTYWLGVLFDKYNKLQPYYDLDPARPERAMAYRLTNTGSLRNQDHTMDSYLAATEKYKIDGAVFFA